MCTLANFRVFIRQVSPFVFIFPFVFIGKIVGVEENSISKLARPNILFIIVDDLRPELGCYGNPLAQTPRMDSLAAESILFENAACMVPTCGASRASLFSGVRPTRNRFSNYNTRTDKDAPWAKTLNLLFKEAGYDTISLGKVFHHRTDSASGWTEPPWRSKKPWYQIAENRIVEEGKRYGAFFEAADVEDHVYQDGDMAMQAMTSLQKLKSSERPFFLAVGFQKPHLPFIAPKKYWDLFDRSQFKLPASYRPPFDFPEFTIHQWGELRGYSGIPEEGPVSDETAYLLIHGYYACVSYIDTQIGKILDELKQLELEEDTIVVLTSDHGWNLGEHSMWSKHTCFETAMGVPLIIKVPGEKGNKRASGIVELFDLYPTLCELVGLSIPDTVEGESFLPLLKDPEMEWNDHAIGRFSRGDTIRIDHYRYTEYLEDDGRWITRMLYDHRNDPDESHNIAEKPELKDEIARFSEILHAGMGKDHSVD